jgi:hypothetical protein
MIISMKTINPNCWAPNGLDVPITAPPVANINNLYYSFYVYTFYYRYHYFYIDRFYYRLVSALYILYKDNALDKNNYFDEDN